MAIFPGKSGLASYIGAIMMLLQVVVMTVILP